MKYLFIYTIFPGHVYRTYPLTKRLIAGGHEVHYLFLAKNDPSCTLPSGAEHETLGLPPMYHAFHKYPKDKTEATVREEITQTGSALMEMVNAHQPDQILLDEFCSIELLYLIPAGWASKTQVLTPFLPSFPNSQFPPQNRFAYPGPEVQKIWEDVISTESEKSNANKSLILRLSHEQQIPENHKIWNFNQLHPAFKGIRKVYQQDALFDFGGQPIRPWEKYGGPMVDLARPEKIAPLLTKLITAHLKNNPKNKLVTVSFGSVIQNYLEEDTIKYIFDLLNDLAERFRHLLFIAKLPQTIQNSVKRKERNLIFVRKLPQLELVRMSDLLITHGGGGSVYEALGLGVPMLVIPPGEIFDQPGNAARVVYHQLGLSLLTTSSIDAFCDAISELTQNPIYKTNATKWAQLLNLKMNAL
ncbi:hypothetical protein ADIS_0871 [Lunatimonas lonarensis]|uniref:Glycosyltransferase n=1 Tax=Lunatimonas lonarensis TaxID=1232681 RepID=R7ZX96_9BACT|nr:glycosyltransferase [Lunatimonas lonarensis]EON78697.1 hypothetical protein ADIS_0871 [Lunatimonas lonarensis]